MSQRIKVPFLVRNNLEEKIIDIEEGDQVRFSGKFERGNIKENECLDGGFFADPELLNESYSFNYTKIEKLDGQKCNNFAQCFDYAGDVSQLSPSSSTKKATKENNSSGKKIYSQMTNKYPFLRGSQEQRIQNLLAISFTNPRSISENLEWSFKMMCITSSLDPSKIKSETKKAISYEKLREGGSMRKELLKMISVIPGSELIKAELKNCYYKYFN